MQQTLHRSGSSQQLCQSILTDTEGQLELFKFVPYEFVAATLVAAQTLCDAHFGIRSVRFAKRAVTLLLLLTSVFFSEIQPGF